MKFLLRFLRLFYTVKVRGLRHLPKEGGAILAANHLSYMDALLLLLVSPRPIRFMSAQKFFSRPLLGRILRLAGAIPTSSTNARLALEQARTALENGELLAIFPEGRLSRDGSLQGFKSGFCKLAQNADVRVIPVSLHGMWGSIFSHERGCLFFKKPYQLPYPVTISFGHPLSPSQATVNNTRNHIVNLDSEAFNNRPELQGNIAMEALRTLKKNSGKVVLVDYSMGEPKELKAGLLLALSLLFAKRLGDDKRVGIVLPPGIGASVANLATAFAGKTSVNLNFTAGHASSSACIRKSGLQTIITAAPIKEKIEHKMGGFPWTDTTVDIARELKALPKWKIVLTLLAIKTLPTSLLASLFKVPQKGGDKEAAVLFTSGSESEPKGVVLSHKNLIAQRIQIDQANILGTEQTVMANLPIFHSFGFTVTLWYVLFKAVKTVTVPSPLEFKATADAIEEQGCTVFPGTPTFFRAYLRNVDPKKLRTLKWVIAGAEKTPEGFKRLWKERIGGRYLEGYGLTETSPVVSVNIPQSAGGKELLKEGTVGKLFTGLACSLENPDTGDRVGVGETGVLLLRGASVFGGYLDDPHRTKEVFTEDGWYRTGDLAKVDEEGFLTIQGRISRFSKIGGEMVPHATVETAIAEAFGWQDAEQPQVVVSARESQSKGEELVLLTPKDIDREAVREQLSQKGFANLWIPRVIKQVEEIPVLPTGKLDLKRIRTLAGEA